MKEIEKIEAKGTYQEGSNENNSYSGAKIVEKGEENGERYDFSSSEKGGHISSKEKEEELIREYMPRIETIAKNILKENNLNDQFTLDELTVAGMEGVMKAVRDRDDNKLNGGKFSTYVGYRIKGAILDYIRSFMILTRTEAKKYKRYGEVESDLRKKNGREPTVEEMAKELKLSDDDFMEYVKIFYKLYPQQVFFNSENENGQDGERYLNPSLNSYLDDPEYEKIIDRKKLRKMIKAALYPLEERERFVLDCLLDDIPQKEIAQRIDRSVSTVSNIITKLKTKLMRALRERQDGGFITQYHDDYLD